MYVVVFTEKCKEKNKCTFQLNQLYVSVKIADSCKKYTKVARCMHDTNTRSKKSTTTTKQSNESIIKHHELLKDQRQIC